MTNSFVSSTRYPLLITRSTVGSKFSRKVQVQNGIKIKQRTLHRATYNNKLNVEYQTVINQCRIFLSDNQTQNITQKKSTQNIAQ